MADPSGKALGLEAEGDISPIDEIVADEPPETPAESEEHQHAPPEETPAPEPTPETPTTPETDVPETPAEAPESPEEPTEPQPEGEATPEKLFAGRFDSLEKFEEAYKQGQAWSTRVSQENAELRRAQEAATKERAEVQSYLQQIAPQLRRLAEEEGLEQPQVQPQDIQTLARQEAQKLMAEQNMSQRAEQTQQAVFAFRHSHPEAAGSQIEGDMLRIIKEYDQEAQEDGGWTVTKENLEVAYELATDPRLKTTLDTLGLFPDPDYVEVAKELTNDPNLSKVVMAHPHVVDSVQGMAWAREQAALPQHLQNTQQQQSAERQQQNLDEAKKRAHVEKGSAGAPTQAAPGQRPGISDPVIADLIAMDEKDRNEGQFLGL